MNFFIFKMVISLSLCLIFVIFFNNNIKALSLQKHLPLTQILQLPVLTASVSQ